MSSREITQMSDDSTAYAIASAVSEGRQQANQVIEHFQRRITRNNPSINALICHAPATPKRPDDSDASLASTTKPLMGVPVVIKDNIAVKGWALSCGSKILSGYISPFTASAVERMLAAGAFIIGKSNLDEFAMGSSTEHSCHGPTKNPWDLNRVPGGSSGGSAAAVAAGFAPIALGSDTGGSIRQPAAFCGIVGFKPTYGRVSRYGLVAYGSSLDQIGPMAKTVRDAALVFDVISGLDPRDSTSLKRCDGASLAKLASTKDLSGKKIGIIVELSNAGVQAEIVENIKSATKQLKDLGATVEEVSVPSLKHCVPAYYILATAEASANLARFDGVRYGLRVEATGASINEIYRKSRNAGFGAEVKKRILLGTFVLSSGYYDAYYAKAMALRQKIAKDLDGVFSKYDLLLSPTAPTTAFKIGEKAEDPLSMYLGDICTISANLAGLPALSMPSGFDGNGLPIGLQFMAAKGNDELVLAAGHLFEMARGELGRHPKGFS